MTIIGYIFANGDTVCPDCITSDEEQTEITMYLDEYDDNKLPICDRCQCEMTGGI